MQQHNAFYNLWFCTAVCVVSAVCVSVTAVVLKDRQEENAALDKKRNVLVAAGLADSSERLSGEEIDSRFGPIRQVVIDLKTGEETDVDPVGFDQRKATADPKTSEAAPPNTAKVRRLPNQALVYRLEDESGDLEMLILPIEGKGLWSTLYGFLSLDADMNTIKGITFYEHGETPGLGGEVDNPGWKALWKERKAFGPGGDLGNRSHQGAGRAGVRGSPQSGRSFRCDHDEQRGVLSRSVLAERAGFWSLHQQGPTEPGG